MRHVLGEDPQFRQRLFDLSGHRVERALKFGDLEAFRRVGYTHGIVSALYAPRRFRHETERRGKTPCQHDANDSADDKNENARRKKNGQHPSSMPFIVRHVVAYGKDVSVRQDRLADPHRYRIPTAVAVRRGDPICPVGGEHAFAHLLHDARIGRFNQNDDAFRIGEEEKYIAATVLLDRLAKVL